MPLVTPTPSVVRGKQCTLLGQPDSDDGKNFLLPKLRRIFANLHGVTYQKTCVFASISVRITNFAKDLITSKRAQSVFSGKEVKYQMIPEVSFLFMYARKGYVWSILWNNQQVQLYAVKFIPLLVSLYMFRVSYTPITRSTIFNCIYSHWYKPHYRLGYLLPLWPGTD